jgi:hypothetical protein
MHGCLEAASKADQEAWEAEQAALAGKPYRCATCKKYLSFPEAFLGIDEKTYCREHIDYRGRASEGW